MFLVFYRQVDKPSGSDTGTLKTTIGVSWGIFVAFLFGALLTYAGWRLHARRRPEPLVDGDDPRTTVLEGDPTSVAGGEEITVVAVPDDAPTVAIPPDERPTRIAAAQAAGNRAAARRRAVRGPAELRRPGQPGAAGHLAVSPRPTRARESPPTRPR